MKITVKASVSKKELKEDFDIEDDFGFTEEQWEQFSDDRKREIIFSTLDNPNYSPYWVIESYLEK